MVVGGAMGEVVAVGGVVLGAVASAAVSGVSVSPESDSRLKRATATMMLDSRSVKSKIRAMDMAI